MHFTDISEASGSASGPSAENAGRPAPLLLRAEPACARCLWGAGVCRDCPFELELFVLLYVLRYKSFPERLLAHVTLWHLNHWFNVRLISGNDSSLFTWYDLMTMLNVCTHWKNPTGSFKHKSFLWQSRGGGWR